MKRFIAAIGFFESPYGPGPEPMASPPPAEVTVLAHLADSKPGPRDLFRVLKQAALTGHWTVVDRHLAQLPVESRQDLLGDLAYRADVSAVEQLHRRGIRLHHPRGILSSTLVSLPSVDWTNLSPGQLRLISLVCWLLRHYADRLALNKLEPTLRQRLFSILYWQRDYQLLRLTLTYLSLSELTGMDWCRITAHYPIFHVPAVCQRWVPPAAVQIIEGRRRVIRAGLLSIVGSDLARYLMEAI